MNRALTALAAVGIVGAVTRTHIVALAPLLPAIQKDVGLSHTQAGALTGISVLAMGISAAAVPRVVRRVGSHRTIAIGLLGLGLTGLARAASPGATSLLVTSAAIGVGIGVITTAMPSIMKSAWAARPAMATGTHASGIVFGSSVAALLAAPLATVLGGWRPALAAFAVVSLLGGLAWVRLIPTAKQQPSATSRVGLRARPIVSLVPTLVFTLQTIVFYGIATWLPSAFIELDRPPEQAGALVTILMLAGLPATIVFARLADGIGGRRIQLLLSTVIAIVGTSLLSTAPDLAFVAAAVTGFGLGGLLSVSLALPLDVTQTPSDAAAISAVMFLVGYPISAVAPVLMGAAREAFGSFDLALLATILPLVILLAVGIAMPRPGRLPSPQRVS